MQIIIIDSKAYTTDVPEGAQQCARGCYQRDLLGGHHTWSGSSLRGEAARWGARYAASRDALYGRLAARYGATLAKVRDGKLSGNGKWTLLFPVVVQQAVAA
jgi:hypothetical protein